MNKPIWLALDVLGLNFGMALCLGTSSISGCLNATGYCGGNTPDPDRIGGPLVVFTGRLRQ